MISPSGDRKAKFFEASVSQGLVIKLRSLARLLRLASHLVFGLATEVFLFPHINDRRRAQIIARWSSHLLSVLNVRLSLSGPIPSGASLLAANHISWLDIFVINSIAPSRFVAKSEIRKWPVVGWLCLKAGTYFLERETRSDLKKTTETLTRTLRAGQRVAIFPEGTTSEGAGLSHFHASLIEPAVRGQVAVVPVALRFTHSDGSLNQGVTYVGETTFWQSVKLVLAQRQVFVTLHFCDPLASLGKNRRELARAAEDAIANFLSGTPPERARDREAEQRLTLSPTRNRYRARADSDEAKAQALTSDRKSLGH